MCRMPCGRTTVLYYSMDTSSLIPTNWKLVNYRNSLPFAQTVLAWAGAGVMRLRSDSPRLRLRNSRRRITPTPALLRNCTEWVERSSRGVCSTHKNPHGLNCLCGSLLWIV